MIKQVYTIEEAWNFLIEEVYQNNKGEFRIHNNKDGIRLYLKFYNRKYTGYVHDYCTYTVFVEGQSSLHIYHPELYNIKTWFYEASIVKPNLIDVVNVHLDCMSGNIKHECFTEIHGVKFSGTIEEFILNYNEYHNDRIKHGQISSADFYIKQDFG